MQTHIRVAITNTLTMDTHHYNVIDMQPNAHTPPTRWILTARFHPDAAHCDHLADYFHRDEACEQFRRLGEGGTWYQTGTTFERALIL